jgi:hypothetical protein
VPLVVTPAAALLMVVRMASNDGRDERAATTTLDELRDLMLDGFKVSLAEQHETRELVSAVEARLTTRMDHLSSRVEVLEYDRWGSRRPPPRVPTPVGGVPRPRLPSVSDRLGELDELTGRVMRAEAEAKAAREEAQRAREAGETAVAINKQQSRSMGLAMPEAPWWKKVGAFFASRKGAEFIVAIATLAAAAAGLERATDAAQRAQDALRQLPAQEVPR